ncbi:bacteriohemerythrin [Candidatus Electronema sp. JM]|uniref:bacteriohemerythrin n=1 Tax=Candidatus Electronema sp. JM TaxID=3401571 RepID=UPI003AA821D7
MNSLTTATLLKWDAQHYGTGFAHVDDQHHELFDGLNSLTLFLQNASAANDPENQDKVIELLYFLGEYVIRHFQEEEEIFAKCGHPLADANKEAHQVFYEKYFEYNDKLISGTFSLELLQQLHSFLHSWLINHILKIDMTLHEYAEKSGIDCRSSAGKKGVFAKFLALFQMK